MTGFNYPFGVEKYIAEQSTNDDKQVIVFKVEPEYYEIWIRLISMISDVMGYNIEIMEETDD